MIRNLTKPLGGIALALAILTLVMLSGCAAHAGAGVGEPGYVVVSG